MTEVDVFGKCNIKVGKKCLKRFKFESVEHLQSLLNQIEVMYKLLDYHVELFNSDGILRIYLYLNNDDLFAGHKVMFYLEDDRVLHDIEIYLDGGGDPNWAENNFGRYGLEKLLGAL